MKKYFHPSSIKKQAAWVLSIGIAAILIGWQIAYAGTQTFSSAATSNWVAPYNSTGTVELWGAGGGGGAGGSSNKNGGGGGAGGQYSISIVTFSAGTSYAYVVGTGGAAGVSGGAAAKVGSSTTMTVGGTTYTAVGGAAGASYTAGFAGGVGTSTGGIGTTIYAGGSGANGSASQSGGGGGGAGSTGAGNSASGVTGGAAKSNDGGAGGAGNSSNGTAGTAGSTYGGGGGAGTKSSNGAAGAIGLIVITYNNPAPTLTSISPASTTAGSATTTITLTGTNFASSSAVYWNAAVNGMATTTITSSSITATIPTANLTTATSASITVFTPTPGGGTTSAQTFTVNATLPTVTTQAASAVAATTATANGTLTVTGGTTVDTEGYVYATSTQSTPGNVAATSSGYTFYAANSGSFNSTGAFTVSLSGLTGNTIYFGRAYAHNSVGYSYGTTQVTFLTLPSAPGTPTYSNISTSTVTVTWTAPTGGETYYSLARATSSNGTYAQVTTTTSLSYNDTGLSAGTSYWYDVAGVNASGTGPYSATSTFATNPLPPDATSVSTTTALGGRSGNSITITGTNFGTVATSSAAICSGSAGTGCIEFITGGTATVASASVTSWTSTSITFTISPTLASNGGAGALQVWSANASDTTPLNFYIYPNITAVASIGTNAAREYNASDTDGLVMLSGDHFGTSGTSTILGFTATQFGSTGGPCTVAGYTSTTVCLEVPTAIANNTYSGTIILNRTSDNTQATTSLSILPRITGVSPNSTSTGDLVQLLGNHFCQSGTCPVSPNRSSTTNNVLFGSATSSDSDFKNLTGGGGVCNGSGAAWTDGEICVDVPSAASIGSASTTITSNGSASNLFSFTVAAPPPPNAPGTPSYSSVSVSSMTVSWIAPSGGGAVGYYSLSRSTSSNGTYVQITTTTSLSYGDSGLTGNTSYWYEVQGVNAGGSGSQSATSTQLTLPGVPGTPTYSSVGGSTLTVSWTAPTGGAGYYSLTRATSSNGTYAQITTTTSLSYGDSGLTGSTNYWYKVRGVNGTGNGTFSATSTVTTGSANSAPSTPTENAPANNAQSVATSPTFLMTTTDPDGDAIEYKVIIYSNSGCSTVSQTDDETASQTGWSGQNTSSSHEYTSGTQGSFTVQSALSAATTYYWTASAIDPEGANTWSSASVCNSFTVASGNWTVDSGSWSIVSNTLTVTPGTGNYAQLHVSGQSLTNAVEQFNVSASGGSAGAIGPIVRADSGSNRYQAKVDYASQILSLTKTISNSNSTVSSTSKTASASTAYNVLIYANGSSLTSVDCTAGTASCVQASAGSQTDLTGPGFAGIGASGNNTFSITDFSVYSSPNVTFNSLPSGDSWSALDHSGGVIECITGTTWDTLDEYNYQIPLDYDNGGGQIALWSNASCSGAPAVTYPSSGLSTNIFGGDSYGYSPATSGTAGISVPQTIQASTTITVNAAGLISQQ